MDGWLSYVKSTVTAVSDEIKQTALTLSEDAAGITFVTKRILAIRGMPFDDSQRVGGATIANPVPQQAGGAVSSASGSLSSSCITVKQLSTFLHKHYPDRFMLWNLSEKTYDYTALDNQVIEFRFPGYPAAPLNQVFALCNSIHAWLTADDNNVAVVRTCETETQRVEVHTASLSPLLMFLTPLSFLSVALCVCTCVQIAKRAKVAPSVLWRGILLGVVRSPQCRMRCSTCAARWEWDLRSLFRHSSDTSIISPPCSQARNPAQAASYSNG